MPVASPYHPNIGLSILRDVIRGEGISAEIQYFHLDFVDQVGVDTYELLANARYYNCLLGEWLFSHHYYDRRLTNALNFLAELTKLTGGSKGPTSQDLQLLVGALSTSKTFLNNTLQKLLDVEAKVYGFSTSFEQNMASLLMARLLKQEKPEIKVVFGGANCEGDMGSALLDNFAFIDYAFSGRAENTFPKLLRETLCLEPSGSCSSKVRPKLPISEGADAKGEEAADFRLLKNPKYDDFLQAFALTKFVKHVYRPVPLLETSKGCWWGQKHHCTFCGLNGTSMGYISKAPEVVLADLGDLAEAGNREVLCVDNIVDMGYLKSLFPKVAERKISLMMHLEVKSNLNFDQISVLSRAGARKLQPGIESFSSEVLSGMKKGVRGIHNVRFLKNAVEAGVFAEWLLLYGFPGEPADTFELYRSVSRKLTHLQAPVAFAKVRADRFSPFHVSPEKFGITILPLASYARIYDLPTSDIDRIAYHFEIGGVRLGRADAAVLAAQVNEWRSDLSSELYFVEGDGRCAVIDRRGQQDRHLEMSDVQAAVLRRTVDVVSLTALQVDLADYSGFEVSQAVAELLEREILIAEGDLLLNLALRQPGFRRAFEKSELHHSYALSYAGLTSVGS